jgi:hypothetical protein
MANCTDRYIADRCTERGPEYGPAIAFWLVVAFAGLLIVGIAMMGGWRP